MNDFDCILQFNSITFNSLADITVELRTLGVPWTLHCWMHALAAAHELRLDAVIDQLLQDFLQVCPDDYSSQFVTECLPLLFNIFRYSKVRIKRYFFLIVQIFKYFLHLLRRRRVRHFSWLTFLPLVLAGNP